MIVVLLESVSGALAKTSLPAITAALELKKRENASKVIGLVCGGSAASGAASEAAQFGLDEVVFANSEVLSNYLALNFETACLQILSELKPTFILAASSAMGKDLLPRLAVKFEAAQASDIVAVLSAGGFRRLMFAGNIIADVELDSAVQVVSVRPSAFSAPISAAACPVREVPLSIAADPRQTFVSFESVKSERPDLATARVVVSGGRAMASAENFEKYIAPLADVLGAAVGASRAAVDSGFAPNDWQVGQTGKVVAPELYVAIGISGAIQHLAGMKDSKVIVAVNKDPEAPIFEVADYGLVADLFQAVPELTNEIKKVKG